MGSDSPTPPDGLENASARIEWLLKQWWGGNVSQMARDLSVNNAALSRVVEGQMPGGRLLTGLVATRLVDLVWVLSGERTRGYNQRAFSSGDTCPVASKLIPGGRDEFPDRLTPVSFSLATPWLVESAYWWQVSSRNLATEDAETGVRHGDYFLIETSRQRIDPIENWPGRLIVVRNPEGRAMLGKVGPDVTENSSKTLELTVYPVRKISKSKPANEAEYLEPTIASLKPDRSRSKSKRTPRTAGSPYYCEDVVGIVVQALRHEPRAAAPPAPAPKPKEEEEDEYED